METSLSFEHVLHSYGLRLVSTYKYELGNWLFDFIFYLLSFFQLRQNSMTHLNECLLFNTKKPQQCCIKKLNPSFKKKLHQGMVTNEH
jgi:hypothetical protein